MATEQQVAAAQARWEGLDVELAGGRRLADFLRESDLMDLAHKADEECDTIEHEMFDLENWLVSNDAPGWVAT